MGSSLFILDLYQWPPSFLAAGTCFTEDSFSMDLAVGDGFRMIQTHYLYCALYFYYCYIISTSDHQALDPGSYLRIPALDNFLKSRNNEHLVTKLSSAAAREVIILLLLGRESKNAWSSQSLR